ncbi:YdcF family protein [Nocardia nova]|uniref:YdcF family protein n=1 Tax=Nocardia nova TaxID=37330 RepID=UPI001FE5F7EE|nr:YdcF family protein [Nocardia nova]
MSSLAGVPTDLHVDVRTLWDYNRMGHEVRAVDVGIGLGSHDIGVATYAAELFRRGVFPAVVFTGATAPTTVMTFPRGEAVHYREHAVALGVSANDILVEPRATNTAENIDFSRALLRDSGRAVESVMLICRPYQQRRSYATCRMRWPEVEVVCGSLPESLDDYVARIGDVERVVTMLVGDTQRVWRYAAEGWAIEQDVPEKVRAAYDRLVAAGFTGRLLPPCG